MSLESDVASLLRNDPVPRINFKIETISVDKAGMECVAKAIDAKDIAVEIAGTGPKLGAAYSSFLARTVAHGEKKLIGKITLGSADAVVKPVARAGVFHESVHGLMDVKGWKPSMHNDEVTAYLADAMYLRLTKTTVSGGPQEMAIYNAAFAVIDKHQMLAKPVSLKWADCDGLRDAIKAHPAY
jgi:hypothetical protein